MLQTLLADRFRLVTHREIKEIPVAVLSQAKSGSKLKESLGKSTPSKESLPPAFRQLSAQTLAALIATSWMPTAKRVYLAGQDRPASWIAESLQFTLGGTVIDQTGLTGRYDYYFDFAPENSTGVAADPSDPAQSVFTALQNLGLRLDERRVPFDVLVIDSADRFPTEN